MKLYFFICIAAVASACVSCMSRNGEDALVATTDPFEKSPISPVAQSGQYGW